MHKIEITNIFASKKSEIHFFIKFHSTKPAFCLANNNVLNKILHVVFTSCVLKFLWVVGSLIIYFHLFVVVKRMDSIQFSTCIIDQSDYIIKFEVV